MRDCPSPDLSVRERLAILRRWESAQEDRHNDDDEGNNPRIFSGDDHSTTQCVVVETEDSDPDSCVLDLLPRFMWVCVSNRRSACSATLEHDSVQYRIL